MQSPSRPSNPITLSGVWRYISLWPSKVQCRPLGFRLLPFLLCRPRLLPASFSKAGGIHPSPTKMAQVYVDRIRDTLPCFFKISSLLIGAGGLSLGTVGFFGFSLSAGLAQCANTCWLSAITTTQLVPKSLREFGVVLSDTFSEKWCNIFGVYIQLKPHPISVYL